MESFLTLARNVLTTTPGRWISLTSAFPRDLLSRKPAPREWSALDCLQHLVDTERLVFPARVRAFMAGQDLSAYDQDHQGNQVDMHTDPVVLALDFRQLRETNLVELGAITPSDLDRSVRHPELGTVTLSELIHDWVTHDLNHTVQAERALMQPFIPGTGPWRSYFTDHFAHTDPSL